MHKGGLSGGEERKVEGLRLPKMKYVENRSQKQIVQFLGVNYGENTRDGELAESRNLSSRMFPCLSQRQGREIGVESYEKATAVWYRDGLMVVDGIDLLYNGVKVGTVSEGKKQFANVNTKVVIFPDKVMYDIESNELRSLEAEYVSEPGIVEFTDGKTVTVHLGNYRGELVSSGKIPETLVKVNGESTGTYVVDYVTMIRVNPEDGTIEQYWDAGNNKILAENMRVGMEFVAASLGIDGVTSWGKITKINTRTINSAHQASPSDPNIWYLEEVFYSWEYDHYEAKGTSYGDFSGWEAMNFRVGDTVEISGCTTLEANNTTLTVRSFSEKDVNGQTMYSLVFDPDTLANGTEAGAVTIKRSVPNLTVICEKDNRLYGAEGDTIYVSALGDPTNMKTYDGIDTDSYTVAVATEGDFTGCIGYGSSVLFFKEDCMHKLMGSYPSQYALYDYSIPGVVKGSEGSLCNINEVVYYHGREGVYRYAGGSPELISANFGLRRFDTAAAGAQGEHYYIGMRDKGSDTWGLWVYDIRSGIWLQEDDTRAVDFARDGGKLYFIGSDGKLALVNPDSSEEQMEWSATLCVMNEVYLNRKCYSKLLMRLEIDEGAEMKIEVACDGGEFVEHQMFTRGAHRTANAPIRPNRCDSFQIRLSGTGRTVIRAIAREFELGSDY